MTGADRRRPERRYQVGVFARDPVPGRTKTRLIPALGPEGAAELHRAFIEDTLHHVFEVEDCQVTLFHADAEPGEQLVALADRTRTPLRAQEGSSLGERMSRALSHMLRSSEAAMVVGTDAPTFGAASIRDALRKLATHAPWCLGPSADGGYVCIGARRGVTLRFTGVRFSTRHALEDTVDANSHEVGPPALLAPGYDIDNPRDLRLLRVHLSMRPDVAPRSAEALRNLGDSPGNW